MARKAEIVEPVSVTDIALLSEGLLSADRAAVVESFLSESTGLSVDGTNQLRQVSALESRVRFLASWARPLTVASLLVAALIGCGTFMTQQSAIAATLGTAQSHLDRGIVTRLQEIRSSSFISNAEYELCSILLARFHMAEAEIQFHAEKFGASDYSHQDNEFLVNVDRAIAYLDSTQSQEAHELRFKAYWLLGRGQLLFGTSARGLDDLANEALVDSSHTLLDAIDNYPQAHSFEIPTKHEVYAALGKALYKGGLHYAADRQQQLVDRLRATISLPNCDTSEIALEIARLVIRECRGDAMESLAYLRACSLAGLYLKSRPDMARAEEAAEVLTKALAHFEDHESDSYETALEHGRLLGNTADAFRRLNKPQQDLEYGRQAVQHFQAMLRSYNTPEVLTELGWTTARNLIAEYRHAVVHDLPLTNTAIRLGGLQQITNQLGDWEGLQMGQHEIEIIFAIAAEILDDRTLMLPAESLLKVASASNGDVRNTIMAIKEQSWLKDDGLFQEAVKLIEDESKSATNQTRP